MCRMIDPLLVIPNATPQAGSLPHYLKADYLGYYDSGRRQLVFAYRHDLRCANIYISTYGWREACATVRGPKIFADVILAADEAQWLFACWSAAATRFGRTAIENYAERELVGMASRSSVRVG